ncbi:MAG: hypothetical protein MUE94_00350 [Verrucomicrobia bacterium]|nr:hypothetical protein [Verrucomicrobiota bacterium]
MTNAATSVAQAYRLASTLTPLPTLQIAATPSNAVVISWPTTATAAGFALQTALGLPSPPAWDNATNPVGLNGSLNFITDLITASQRSYRLHLVPAP